VKATVPVLVEDRRRIPAHPFSKTISNIIIVLHHVFLVVVHWSQRCSFPVHRIMGKQSHRKRSQKKGPTSGKPKSSATLLSSSSCGSLLLQRLRHADPRTRHAALAALSTTILDPDTLASRQAARSTTVTPFLSISTDVLQAIRERVMDEDLECAHAAAGCLNNYVSFCPAPKQDICAGWTILFVGRLQQCRDILSQQQQQQPPTTTAAVTTMTLQWTALAVQSLQTLCALVENNPLAVERIQQHSTVEVMQVLLDLLSMAVTRLQQPSNESTAAVEAPTMNHVAANPSASDKDTKLQQQQQRDAASMAAMLQTMAIYAARTLHSALDDNSDLLLPWLVSSASLTQAKAGMQLVQQCCSTTDSSRAIPPPPPPAAQLHCSGCLVTARQQVIMALATPTNQTKLPQQLIDQTWADFLQDAVLVTVLPLLQKRLQCYDPTASQLLLEQYVQATLAFQKEVEDSQMERDVIHQVEQRHEPARSIARRQKAMKEQKQQQQQASNRNEQQDNGMKNDHKTETCDDGVDEKMQDTATPKDEKKSESDRRDAMEQARQAFQAFLLPLQLALEITANLTSPSDVGEDHDDHDEHMEVDDEDENELVVATTVDKIDAGNNPVALADLQLMAGLVEQSIPDQVLALLQQVCRLPATSSDIPHDAMDEISNVISKCAACLGNCMANLTWRQIPSTTMWSTLQECMMIVTNSNMTSTDAIDGLWTTMAIAVKSHDSIRKLLKQPDDIEWLLTQLSSQQITIVGQREIVAMLGLWCREELHPSELNHKVCQALLSLLAVDSLMVTNEILNALMDMYGNDDHDRVVDSLHVLEQLQRTLTTFKRRLQHADEQEESEFLELWNETALNAERFILYKKSQ
jgi:hypothetical protein